MTPRRTSLILLWLVLVVSRGFSADALPVEDQVIVEATLESYMVQDPLGIWTSPTPQFFSSVAALKSVIRYTNGPYADWAAANSVKGLVFKIRWPPAHYGKQFTMHVNCTPPLIGEVLGLFHIGHGYRIEATVTNIGRDDFGPCFLGTHWKRIEPPMTFTPTGTDPGASVPLICRVESYVSQLPTHGSERGPIRYYSPDTIVDPSWGAEEKAAAEDPLWGLEVKADSAGLRGVELLVVSPACYAGRRLSLHHTCSVTTNVLAVFPWQEDLEVVAPTNEIGRGDFLLGSHAVTVRRLSGSQEKPANQSRQPTAAPPRLSTP
jgi:hypothetical protein